MKKKRKKQKNTISQYVLFRFPKENIDLDRLLSDTLTAFQELINLQPGQFYISDPNAEDPEIIMIFRILPPRLLLSNETYQFAYTERKFLDPFKKANAYGLTKDQIHTTLYIHVDPDVQKAIEDASVNLTRTLTWKEFYKVLLLSLGPGFLVEREDIVNMGGVLKRADKSSPLYKLVQSINHGLSEDLNALIDLIFDE